jgi:hypothetical protein
MNKVTAYGKVENGQLILHSRKRFVEDIRQCKDAEVILTIKKRGRASQPQRGYLFGCVYKELQLRFLELGHRLDIDEVHEWAKAKFNPERILDEWGTVLVEYPGSTAEMNKEEMGLYIDAIREYAQTVLNCFIPDPNSKNEMNFE